jgi:DNA end-binding protein Ku
MAEPAEMDESAAGGPQRVLWSGTVSFGLVSIPVNLVAGVRHIQVALRMLGPDGTPLSRRYACSREETELAPEHIVRGYEVAADRFVVVSDDELEALAPAKSRDIDLQRFVALSEIDPVYFDHPYYLAAAGGSTKAYRLLAQTMEETGRAGIATFVMRGKEYLIAIVAEQGVLRAETLRFADELRGAAAVGLPKEKAATARGRTQMRQVLRRLRKDGVDTGTLVDERDRRLIALIETKAHAHRDVVTADVPEEPGDAVVVDLMERLEQSLRGGRRRTHGGKRRARRAA